MRLRHSVGLRDNVGWIRLLGTVREESEQGLRRMGLISPNQCGFGLPPTDVHLSIQQPRKEPIVFTNVTRLGSSSILSMPLDLPNSDANLLRQTLLRQSTFDPLPFFVPNESGIFGC
jgi:hypothetical protein